MCHPNDDTVGYGGGAAEQQLELPGSNRKLPGFAYGYYPEDKRPAVIIIHDIYGPKQLYRDLGKRLADEGYAAFLPDLFAREGPLAENTPEAARARGALLSFPTALDDIIAIVTKLVNEGRNVGLVGFCMGGTLVMLAASRMPTLKAGVIYYGFPFNPNPTDKRPNNPIEEVNDLKVPLRGFFGEGDTGVGSENVRAYQEAAHKAGKEVEFTLYPEVGHGFLTFDPAAPTAQASQDSWARALAFLGKQLGQ